MATPWAGIDTGGDGLTQGVWALLDQPQLGQAVRLLRHCGRMSGDALASALQREADVDLGIDAVGIWRWERAKVKDVSRRYRKLLAAVCEREAADMNPMSRRELLEGLAALAGVSLIPDPERLLSMFGHPATRVDEQTLTDLELLTGDYARRHRETAPRSVLPTVVGHVARMKALLPQTPAHLLPRLQVDIGEATITAGWLAWYCENRGDAEDWWRFAATLADEAGDHNLKAHALVADSALHSTQGWRPLDGRGATERLSAALRQVKGSPRLEAWVLGRQAEENALAGRAADAYRDLDASARAMARALAEAGTFAGARNADHLDAYRGNVALHLGDGQLAAQCLGRVLEHTPAGYLTARCWSLLDLSEAQALLGDGEGAAAALAEAVTIARQAGLTAYRNRARSIRARRLSRWSNLPAVQRLDELLA